MSGHSKFANIKHKKEKNDAAKGKIFTKLGKELAVAVKEGGSADPANNSRLRDVIAKAKAITCRTIRLKEILRKPTAMPMRQITSILHMKAMGQMARRSSWRH